MRAILTLLALPALALVPTGTSQDTEPPGCVEANPCQVVVGVDAAGISDVSATEFTQGDWLVATIINHDDVPHTVTLASHDLSLTVPGNGVGESPPFRLGSPGTYAMQDQPSGDALDVTVMAPEEFNDGSDQGNGAPGLGVALLATVVLVAAALARRRR